MTVAREINLLDVVELVEDIPKSGLRAGMLGTVIEIFSNADPMFEVEFCDEGGKTIAQIVVSGTQLRRIWSRS